MGSPYDPPDRDGYGRGVPGDETARRRRPRPNDPPPAPHGRAPVPDRGPRDRGRGGPPEYPRGRVSMPRDERYDAPYDGRDEQRRPANIGRASVRPGPESAVPQDPYHPEPVSGSAPVGGRHAARGLLPASLSIRRAMRLRGRLLSTSFAILLVLLGSGVVGGSMFLDSVQLSGGLTFPETTTIFFSNNTRMAQLGAVTRYELPYERISLNVQKAIVASEDQTFWTNEGIDVGGVMRAAWNNFTGGRIQGASTITQQYARLAYELGGVTYQRKFKEAVLAWKMSKSMDKKEILAGYLNAASFGRQAYGIEAAARAFFNKTADNTAPPERQLTLAEAMALVAMVKQPYPDPADPVGSPGYDPTVSEAAAVNAQNRFEYVRGQLDRIGSQPCVGWPSANDCTVSHEEVAALQFPQDVIPYTPVDNGREGAEGHIVNQVLSELTHTPSSPFYGAKDWKFIEEGGYQIHTTIDPSLQAEARKAASRSGNLMANQRENLQAALVAVQPGTGRVLAYYGGDDGLGNDYAGTYLDENDIVQGVGYHPPGSSFKVYTLAAALKDNISLKSYWNWNPHDMPGREGGKRIQNTSNCGELPAGDPTPCSLLQSLISSVNVTFYQVTLTVGAQNVLAMARDAGIESMWTNERERVDLRSVTDMNTVVRDPFDYILGIGQYPVTVLDHANGLATIAAAGRRAEHHFVQTVTKNDQIIYGETLPDPNSPPILSPTQINDLTYAMSQVAAAKTNIGWDTAGKTGTWEYGPDPDHNAHAWMVGFSREIAVAVWVGNHDDEQPILTPNGGDIYGSGLPASIWKQFMGAATTALNQPRVNTKFNPPNYLGDTNPEGSVPSPTPTFNLPPGFPTFPGWPPRDGGR